MRMLTAWLAALVAAFLCLGSSAWGQEESRVKAAVGILPVKYMVGRVGGGLVEVSALVGPGQEPHTFEPTMKQVADLSSAGLYFSLGLPFEEKLLEKVRSTSPDLRVVDLRRGITLRAMEGHEHGGEHDGHEHGDEEEGHEHAAGEPDPHVWLSPRLARAMAGNICAALAVTAPDHAESFRKNLKALEEDLDRLDARLSALLAPLKGQEFLVYHPAFGYFADAYGLVQVSVEVAGKQPTARQLAGLIDVARSKGIRVIFVQKEFPTRAAEAVAESVGGAVVPLDPLAYDYVRNMEDMANTVAQGLAGARPTP